MPPPIDPCMDDPKLLFDTRVCLDELSKNVEGEFAIAQPDPRRREQCPQPGQQPCQTLKVIYDLVLPAIASAKCDSVLGRLLDGRITVAHLVTAFKLDGLNRGLHAGDFAWTGTGFQLTGRLAGLTRVGTHRQPATLTQFQNCQESCNAPLLQGRLYGSFTKASGKLAALQKGRLTAVYRWRYTPRKDGSGSGIQGVIEGMLVRPC